MADMYSGYQTVASRRFAADWNVFFPPYYGGGQPEQDRIYEYMTLSTEPFPTHNGSIGAPYAWYEFSFTPTYWYGYKGGTFGDWNDVTGNFRRYASVNGATSNEHAEANADGIYKWLTAGYVWWDAFRPSGFVWRNTAGQFSTATSVRRVDEVVDVRSYETLNPSQLTSGQSTTKYWGQASTGVYGGEPASDGYIYTNRKYVAIQDTGASLTGVRMIFRVHKDSNRIDTPATPIDTPEKFLVYAKTTAPSLTYPWKDTWSGSLIGEINLSYGDPSASGQWIEEIDSGNQFKTITTETRAVTGASFSFGSVSTRFESADWTTYIIDGLSFSPFQQGNYIEVQIVPYHATVEPLWTAAMTTGATCAQGEYYHATSLKFSVDWETQITLPQYWYLAPGVTGIPRQTSVSPQPVVRGFTKNGNRYVRMTQREDNNGVTKNQRIKGGRNVGSYNPTNSRIGPFNNYQ